MCPENSGPYRYYILGESRTAMDYVKQTLKKNPLNENATALQIRLLGKENSIETIIEQTPQTMLESVEIAFAIASIAQQKNNYSKAEEWLRIAIKKDTKSNIMLKGTLGSAIMQNQLHGKEGLYLCSKLNDKEESRINEAIELLTSAWDSTEKSLRPSQVAWLHNLALAKRIIGRKKEAYDDMVQVVKLDPFNEDFKRKRIMLLYETSGPDSAIEFLKNGSEESNINDGGLFLSELLMQQGKKEEAPSLTILMRQFSVPG